MRITVLIAIILLLQDSWLSGIRGFSRTTREKAVNPDPLEMTAEKTGTLPLPPIFGCIASVGGIGLLVKGIRKG